MDHLFRKVSTRRPIGLQQSINTPTDLGHLEDWRGMILMWTEKLDVLSGSENGRSTWNEHKPCIISIRRPLISYLGLLGSLGNWDPCENAPWIATWGVFSFLKYYFLTFSVSFKMLIPVFVHPGSASGPELASPSGLVLAIIQLSQWPNCPTFPFCLIPFFFKSLPLSSSSLHSSHQSSSFACI